MKYGLEQEDIDSINAVFSEYPEVEKVILYGSRAKGNYKPYSDIDLTLVGNNLTLSQQFGIETELDDLLLPYKIDLSIFHKIENKDLIDHIERVGIEFYNNSAFAKSNMQDSQTTRERSVEVGYRDWEDVELGSLIEIKYGKDHKKLEEGNIPCLGSGGVMRYVNQHLYNKVSILIPRKGSLNNIQFLREPFWTVDTLFWSRIDESKVNPEFLFYQLKLVDFTVLNVGSAVPSLTVPVVNAISISLPSLKEQKAIAQVLTSLDDKIDLLHRQNETLEQLAQTLFRQWLMEEASEDWEEMQIKDIAKHCKTSIKPIKYPDTIFKHYSLPAYDSNQSPLLERGYSIKSNKYLVEPFSVLMSKLNPRFPRVWLNLSNVDDVSICSTEFQVIKPLVEENIGFVYTLLNSALVSEKLTMSASGTSGSHQRVKPEDIFNVSFQCKHSGQVLDFSMIVNPLLERTVKNKITIQTLSRKRDTLLPKLMSGEVRVKY